MCIVGVSVNQSDSFPFVLCSNRDEYTSRLSIPPQIKEKVLCGIDKKSNGTWLGLNVENGVFSVVTNIGSSKAKKSRGELIKNILEKNQIQQEMKNREDYSGFNLLYGNLYKKSNLQYFTNRMKDTSNCHVLDSKSDVILANDLVGDEFVKSPYLKNKMKSIIENNENIYKLRDDLGDLMSEKQCHPLDSFNSFSSFISKFIKFGGERRKQPGFITFTYLLLFSLMLLLFNKFLFFGMFGVSLVAGLYHHWCLQNLFVQIYTPGKHRYGTISQTVIISDQKSIYYFFRETFDLQSNQWKIGKWMEFNIDKPNE